MGQNKEAIDWQMKIITNTHEYAII